MIYLYAFQQQSLEDTVVEVTIDVTPELIHIWQLPQFGYPHHVLSLTQ
jgi:hypothetical protein